MNPRDDDRLDNSDDGGTGGGQRVNRAEGREDQDDFDVEYDDKEPGDFEADGPEELGVDPDYEP